MSYLLTYLLTCAAMQMDQSRSGDGGMSFPMKSREDVSEAEKLLWSMNELSVVYSDQKEVRHNPINTSNSNYCTNLFAKILSLYYDSRSTD